MQCGARWMHPLNCSTALALSVESATSVRASVSPNSTVSWKTPQACAYGHMSVVTQLILAEADVNRINVLGASALICAARGGHTDVVETLIAASANLDADPNSVGKLTPLMAAAMAGA